MGRICEAVRNGTKCGATARAFCVFEEHDTGKHCILPLGWRCQDHAPRPAHFTPEEWQKVREAFAKRLGFGPKSIVVGFSNLTPDEADEAVRLTESNVLGKMPHMPELEVVDVEEYAQLMRDMARHPRS